MSDPTVTPTSTSSEDTRCSRRGRRGGRRGFFAGLIAGGLLATGVLGATAIAAGPTGMAGLHGHFGDDVTLDVIEARMTRGAAMMLDEVDATDAQRDAVDALIRETAPDVVAHRLEGQALRDALLTELAAEQVDGDRVQQLREQGLALIDDGSAGHVDAVLALSEILDADQRRELVAVAEAWHR